mmetsp:Transcript_9274/g.12156  ORF Transcript_9274/g.12156 Transcript_9274/m.12156 type:complete len:291 (-) Transcript_9274:210-1082(-)
MKRVLDLTHDEVDLVSDDEITIIDSNGFIDMRTSASSSSSMISSSSSTVRVNEDFNKFRTTLSFEDDQDDEAFAIRLQQELNEEEEYNNNRNTIMTHQLYDEEEMIARALQENINKVETNEIRTRELQIQESENAALQLQVYHVLFHFFLSFLCLLFSTTTICIYIKKKHEEVKAKRRAENIAAKDGGRDVLSEMRKSLLPFVKKQFTMNQMLQFESFHINKYANCGERLYEVFLGSWTDSNMQIKLCFHGTPNENVESILRDGLDPKRRTGQAMGKGEYFGLNPLISYP